MVFVNLHTVFVSLKTEYLERRIFKALAFCMLFAIANHSQCQNA